MLRLPDMKINADYSFLSIGEHVNVNELQLICITGFDLHDGDEPAADTVGSEAGKAALVSRVRTSVCREINVVGEVFVEKTHKQAESSSIIKKRDEHLRVVVNSCIKCQIYTHLNIM
ncbi:hypothetical protein E2C01_049202 [Portunus trituberculatus]|uniref:Uncharacterized protein n=1 Tax=Portunus trituberculatus TaxID=210409 RepID=A0A5B7G505_PORTR|nr:hypothetical protein [Portunus trituberculatus]